MNYFLTTVEIETNKTFNYSIKWELVCHHTEIKLDVSKTKDHVCFECKLNFIDKARSNNNFIIEIMFLARLCEGSFVDLM